MNIQGACTPVHPARSHISKWKESKFLTDGHNGGHRNATQANGCASRGDPPLSDQTGESLT